MRYRFLPLAAASLVVSACQPVKKPATSPTPANRPGANATPNENVHWPLTTPRPVRGVCRFTATDYGVTGRGAAPSRLRRTISG
jgi:hypothetical protein